MDVPLAASSIQTVAISTNAESEGRASDPLAIDVGPFLRQEGRPPVTTQGRARADRRADPPNGAVRFAPRPSPYEAQFPLHSRSGGTRPITLWMASLVRQIRQPD